MENIISEVVIARLKEIGFIQEPDGERVGYPEREIVFEDWTDAVLSCIDVACDI